MTEEDVLLSKAEGLGKTIDGTQSFHGHLPEYGRPKNRVKNKTRMPFRHSAGRLEKQISIICTLLSPFFDKEVQPDGVEQQPSFQTNLN